MGELRRVRKAKPEYLHVSSEEFERVERAFDMVIQRETSEQRDEGRKFAIEHGLGSLGRSKKR